MSSDYIDYHEIYSLPEFVAVMIPRARLDAERSVLADKKKTPDKSDILILAERYRRFHSSFCMCSRHTIDEDKDHPENNDPNDPQLHGRQTQPLTKEQRRGHLQLIVNAHAALCYIGRELYAYTDQLNMIRAYMAVERESQPADYADGSKQQAYVATNFFENHTITGVVHPRLVAWTRKIMGESDNPAERNPEAVQKTIIAYQAMFEPSDRLRHLLEPTPVRTRPPCSPSQQHRAAAANYH